MKENSIQCKTKITSIFETFNTGGGLESPSRTRSLHVYLEANRILFSVNQPKAKTTTMPVWIPVCSATCSLHYFNHIFVYVVHNCLAQSRLIGGLDRDHH
uniref:Uncharacterized protein n=1 Tax=Hyaloperonospora arabidopsidis (strain Emoy2) TaxID=559515 RepID=M4B344_HYAAE